MTSEYTGAEADELVDHRDSQRPARCRGPKLDTKGITCWLATGNGVDASIADRMEVDGDSETSFDDDTGAIKVSTSVFIKDPEGLPSSCEYDVYWSCGTPHSLWCRVYSTNSRGAEKKEAHLWMCSTRPTTQSRSTKYWRKQKLPCPKPLSSALSEDMRSIRLELYRLKGPVVVLSEGKDDVKFDMLDEDNPWIVFEFNFKWQALMPHPSSLSSLALVRTKRKREGSPPVTRSTRRRRPFQSSSNALRIESSPEVESSNSSVVGTPLTDYEECCISASSEVVIQQATGHLSRTDLVSSLSSGSSSNMATQPSSGSVSQAPLPSGSSNGSVNQANHSILTSKTRIDGSGSKEDRARAKLLFCPEETSVSSSTSSNDSEHRRKKRIQSSTRPSVLPPMSSVPPPVPSVPPPVPSVLPPVPSVLPPVPSEPTSTASIASTSAQSTIALPNDDIEELEKENKRLAAELAKKREVKCLIAKRLAAEREKRRAKLKEENELMKRELAELDLYISEHSRQ